MTSIGMCSVNDNMNLPSTTDVHRADSLFVYLEQWMQECLIYFFT